MDAIPQFKELINLGAAGLMFAAYFLTHRSSFTTIKDMMNLVTTANNNALTTQKEAQIETVKNITSSFEQISQSQLEQERRDFELQKEQIETMQMVCNSIARLESKIDSNNYCPMISRKGDKNA